MLINEILEFNKTFIEEKGNTILKCDKMPKKKLAILTCMDTRLSELLMISLDLKDGDAKIIRNAGGITLEPFGETVKSLLVCIYELGVSEIMVIGHDFCGVENLDTKDMIEKIKKQVSKDTIKTLDFCGINLNKWLAGSENMETSVKDTVNMLKEHILIPNYVNIDSLMINPNTGVLRKI